MFKCSVIYCQLIYKCTSVCKLFENYRVVTLYNLMPDIVKAFIYHFNDRSYVCAFYVCV